ncbi:ComEC/Rec2 family competence protein [Pontiellaceae bacterium B1224]|nr:ComEC/Rec2 family competence protein [Pontiellaceae bacterium B1224]
MASTQILSPSLLFFLAIFCVALAFLFIHSAKSTHLVFMAVALTAGCRFLIAQPDLASDSLNRLEVPEGTEIQLTGRVSGFPEFHAYDSGVLGLWIVPLKVESVSFSNDWKTASGKIDVKLNAAPPMIDLKYEDVIEVTGTLQQNYFPGRNAHFINTRVSGVQLLKSSGIGSPIAWGRAWRDSVAPRLETGLDTYPLQEQVLKALVLGYRKEMPSEVTDVFRRTGALHIFAISGLHVGIVGLLLALVLKTFGMPRDKFGLLLIPLLSLYVISTGMKPSAIRALLMAAVFILAPLFRRKPDIPTSVAFAAVVLLVFQPLEILSAGFIFSFTVVAFLVMVYSSVPKHWTRGSWIWVYTKSLLITSVAAGLASIPLAALFFGTFAPIAFIGNIIVVPLTFCIVLCGWLSILLPIAAGIFNAAAVVFIDLLLGSVQWLDRLPGSSWRVEPPSLFAVVLWYASLIALFTICSRPRQRLLALGSAAFAMVLALLS